MIEEGMVHAAQSDISTLYCLGQLSLLPLMDRHTLPHTYSVCLSVSRSVHSHASVVSTIHAAEYFQLIPPLSALHLCLIICVFVCVCLCVFICLSVCHSVHGHTGIVNTVRSAEYFQLIPPLLAECVDLDGNASSLPVIFEDVYAEQVIRSLAATTDPLLAATASQQRDDDSLVELRRSATVNRYSLRVCLQ